MTDENRNSDKLSLSILPESFAICRLEPDAQIPGWCRSDSFYTVSRTPEELSIICPEAAVPERVHAETGWRGLRIEGFLDFEMFGILSSIIAPLAEAKMSILTISTYDTDYIFIKGKNLPKAREILSERYNVQEENSS